MISRRFNRDDPRDDRGTDPRREGAPADEDFTLEKTHERRILSWSPDPEGFDEPEPEIEDEPEVAEPAAVPPPPPPLQPARVAPQARLAPHTSPVETRPVQPQPAPAAPPQAPQAQAVAADTPAVPAVPAAPAPTERREVSAPPAATGQEPRRRGRPRGRPRRQVHFHVDPDEELLLLEAAKRHGSQQKGLVAALQALQDNEVLRAEVERLRIENERQRALLADAEAIFNR